MRIKELLAASAVAASLAFAAPAAAQPVTGVEESGPGSADGNTIAAGSFNDFLDLLSNNLNGSNRDNTTNSNFGSVLSSNLVTAEQNLIAINVNQQLDEVVDLDGEDGSETPVGYNSGANYVRGNAFAAFAGINSYAMNTGINNNVQSGVNLAAQGTVNFGPAGAGTDADPAP